ncbi:MAG TPA: hypothetical protein VN089_13840 [Duganella sp.]|nr:hypothetical protein [Duganella sp.]
MTAFGCPQLLAGRHKPVHYATASVDTKARAIDIRVSVDYRMPSLAARAFGRSSRVDEDRFIRYVRLADAGLREYWSRTITLNGADYTVSVSARQTTNGLPLVLAHTGSRLLGPLSSRSSNPYPLLSGNLYYEPHHDSDSDAMFTMTAAHEIGHAFLTSAFGIRWSWGHGGTSSIFGRMAATAPPYPPSGEIGLMTYYRNNETETIYRDDILRRTIASENDVKTLLFIAGRS